MRLCQTVLHLYWLRAPTATRPLQYFYWREGADPNAADSYGASVLHYALLKGIASISSGGSSFNCQLVLATAAHAEIG